MRLERPDGAGIARLTVFAEPLTLTEEGRHVSVQGHEWVVVAAYATQTKDHLAWWLKLKNAVK